MSQNSTPEVVVVGGGIAAVEFVLALRDLASDGLSVTLVAPEPDLVLRPTLVSEPLGAAGSVRHRLAEIAADLGIHLVRASVSAIDARARRVVLRAGGTLLYDTLVLAPGVRRLPAFDDAIHIGDDAGTRGLQALREDIGDGAVRSVAFVAPTLTGWLLPLYEAALLTARLDPAVRVTLITPEETPLTVFGARASADVARALADAGVEFIGGRQAGVKGGAVVLRGAPEATIAADRIVSLPLVRGPRLVGVPETGLYGLIPIDGHGRVKGLADVYAIGDATDFPIKQGGLACQQAAAAAAHVAARHGADIDAKPFRPVLRASLLTGTGDPIALGDDDGPAPGKIPGRYLAPYLASRAQTLTR
jgi:sulfide:quinone oxidoreductase